MHAGEKGTVKDVRWKVCGVPGTLSERLTRCSSQIRDAQPGLQTMPAAHPYIPVDSLHMGLQSTSDLPHLKTNNRRGHGGGRDPTCQSSFDMATCSVGPELVHEEEGALTLVGTHF